MKLGFSRKQRPHTIYVLESFRDQNGVSTTRNVETLGSEEEIEMKYGCPDGLVWAREHVAELNRRRKERKEKISVSLSPCERINPGEQVLFEGGDLLLLPVYSKLGLKRECELITKGLKVKYDLSQILEALVMMRVIYPCSKKSTFALNKRRVAETTFSLENMYRALSVLSAHIDDIQASVWKNSCSIVSRDTRVIYYDCTNYFFEIEDNDLEETGAKVKGRRNGIRRRGKSKEHRPDPIVQMGMLMDGDGIPLSFIVFAGNESEQPSLQKIEEMIADKYGLNEFVISTDAGLSSEDNRRYNMTEGREYIAVQSLPKLPEEDRKMALRPEGWHIAFRDSRLPPLNPDNPGQDTFNLSEIDLEKERHTKFYKEIIVDKKINGKKSTSRPERVIVTYCHDFALFLRHKRQERLSVADRIVAKKETKSRQSQQDPRRYIQTVYVTPDGEPAEEISMSIDWDVVMEEEALDGFYAYATSLDDDAVDVLRARSFHSEIEHLFRTTKSWLGARPVYLQRADRIRSHFLICFLAMVVLKIVQKQLDMPDVSIDTLIRTLREIRFDYFRGVGYRPLFKRNELTDKLQELAGIQIDTELVPLSVMKKICRKVKGS